MKYIQYRMTTNKPEHSDVLAFYDVETKTIIENRGASETAKIIQLLPDRREREAYDAQLHTKDLWIRALAVALGVFIAIILALLVVDMITPHIGWLKR